MLEYTSHIKLTPDLDARVKNLHKLCRETDGTGDDLFLDTTLNYHQDLAAYYCAMNGTDLVGFLFVFCPMSHEAEVTTFVHPDYRKQGVFNALLKNLCVGARIKGITRLLLVNDRRSKAGCEAMAAMALPLNHSEYAMKHNPENNAWKSDLLQKKSRLERSCPEQMDRITEIRAHAFNVSLEDARHMVMNSANDSLRQLFSLINLSDMAVVGVSGIKVEDDKAYIFGLAVDPLLHGKGWGMSLVAHLLNQLYKQGVANICLDVDSVNNRAYGLYKKCGFEALETIDYYVSELKF